MLQQQNDVEQNIDIFHLSCLTVAMLVTLLSAWGCIIGVLDNKLTTVLFNVQAAIFVINVVLTTIVVNFRAFSRTELWRQLSGV